MEITLVLGIICAFTSGYLLGVRYRTTGNLPRYGLPLDEEPPSAALIPPLFPGDVVKGRPGVGGEAVD